MTIKEIRDLSMEYAKGRGRKSIKKSKRRKWRGIQSERKMEYNRYMDSPEWQKKREAVFKAQGKKCRRCGSERGVLHVHHLTYARFGHEDLEDLQVLCEGCHGLIHPEMKQRKEKPKPTETQEFVDWFARSLRKGERLRTKK